MGIARSTFYDKPAAQDDTAIVRRSPGSARNSNSTVSAAFAPSAKDLAIDGPDQLWVADIPDIAIREGFAYVAVILDAGSRRAIGHAISRSIDMRLTLAALNTAVERRKPPPGRIHPSDRGSQYAAQGYREALLRHGLVGSMGRRGDPYDNPKTESVMKTLKVEAVYPMALTKPSLTSPTIFPDPSTSLQRSSSSLRAGLPARNRPRISNPGRCQISRLIAVRPKGPTPTRATTCRAYPHHDGLSRSQKTTILRPLDSGHGAASPSPPRQTAKSGLRTATI